MSQLTREVWVYLELKPVEYLPAAHSVECFGIRNHLEEGVNIVHLCILCNKMVPGQLPCQLRIMHPPLCMINQMSGCMCSPSISSHGRQQRVYKCRKKKKKTIIGKRIIFMCTCLKTYFSIQ